MLRLGLVTTVLWTALDQASKWIILNHVMDPPQVFPITSFFNVVLGRNTGVSFGLLGGAPAWLLMGVSVVIGAGLILWMKQATDRPAALGLGLIVGGAVGNAIDRWHHGAVTDFLDFYVGDWHWPAFNLADVGIVCGAGLLVVESFLVERRTALSRT